MMFNGSYIKPDASACHQQNNPGATMQDDAKILDYELEQESNHVGFEMEK